MSGMKVVILAGGLGTRMREETEFRPKPMVEVGGKPVLWHIMKIYASHGFKDFVICTGYKGEQIKDYFYNYASRNIDFTAQLGHQSPPRFLASHDELDWTVTVADTGQHTPTGGRLNKVRKYLDDQPFLATYGDSIANVDIASLLKKHNELGKIATVTTAMPRSRFGVVKTDTEGNVLGFVEKPVLGEFVNIGYFVFESAVFDFLTDESVLEAGPLDGIASEGGLAAFRHSGFWQPMDTYRELKVLNELWDSGSPPWKNW